MSLAYRCFASAAVLAAALAPAPAFAEIQDPLTDVIRVTGLSQSPLETGLSPDAAPPVAADASHLLTRLPGHARIGNGALSGQVQHRGLFGPRLAIALDGQRFASGGPNLMDPPLHYAPLPLIERVETARGVSPVRDGPGLGGGLNIVFKRVDFAEEDGWRDSADLTLSARSVDDSLAVGGVAGIASRDIRLQALYARQEGGDTETPYGRIAGTEHQRQVYGLGAGWRSGDHEISLDLRRNETGATGNPPFAMDIRYVDTDTAHLRYDGAMGGWTVEARLGWADVDHAMNNFSLRPAPMMMRLRETFAVSDTRSLSVQAVRPAWGGDVRIGLDHVVDNHDVRITNPADPAFFLNNLPDIEMRRTGGFAEWSGALAGWSAEFGLRADAHEAEAGLASTGATVPMGPSMLAMGFNAGARSWDEVTIDASARLWRALGDRRTLRLTLARKTRAPGYLERFAWLPTPASGGLADGNTYVGDIDLEAETAWIAEIGVDHRFTHGYARPSLFWRQVEDYIQGVPFDATPGVADSLVEMVSTMNGDPTPLRFANTGARLYGVDMDFGWRFDPAWRLDGVLSIVRGERTDIDDALYRIAPDALRLALTREARDWSAGLEMLAVAEQGEVSAGNSEAETPGHVIFAAQAEWAVTGELSLSARADNLLDQRYRDHLGGYNRNGFGDAGLGERLPGEGRGLSLRLHWRR